jgi:hypothetical protein
MFVLGTTLCIESNSVFQCYILIEMMVCRCNIINSINLIYHIILFELVTLRPHVTLRMMPVATTGNN